MSTVTTAAGTVQAVGPLTMGVDAAAARIGISRRSLYRMVAAGDAPHRRVKGVAGVRFTDDDVVAIVDAAAKPATRRRAS